MIGRFSEVSLTTFTLSFNKSNYKLVTKWLVVHTMAQIPIESGRKVIPQNYCGLSM